MSQANLDRGAYRPGWRYMGTVAILIALLLLPVYSIRAQPDGPASKVSLTAAEETFIQHHPLIRLGTDRGWEPYVVSTADGRVSGYDAEILDRVNALTGANFQLVLGRWNEMLEAARERRIDGLSTSVVHAERRDYLDFSNPYISIRKMLLVAKGNPSGINAVGDLAGKTVAIHRGNLADEKLARAVPDTKLMFVDTVEECVDAVIVGQADATFGNGAILYMANRIGMPYLEMVADSGKRLDLVFSVRNDWPEALTILNKGLAAIPEHERLLIQRRWFPGGASGLEAGPLVPLTAQERRYLLDKGRLRLCVDPQWMPYEYLDTDGRYRGIISEIHGAIAKRLGIELEVVRTATWAETLRAARAGRCDLLSAAVETPERSPYLAFTRPFMDVPLVLAARAEQPFIDSILDVSGETFAVIRNHALQDIFKRRYPGIQLIEVDSPLDGLEAVRKRQAFGFIDTSATIGYAIRKHQLIEVKITGKLEERYSLSVGVIGADPLLLSIYDKALKSLPEQVVDQAMARWDSVETVKELDRALLFKILGALALFGLLFLYRDRVISRYSRRLEEANRQLQILSTTDQLTGVANRRKFTEVFAKELARANRYGSPVSLIITDVDHFKAVNDTLGHESGDQVLIQFANLFVEKSRACDLVVRWGGEEFLILCPQTDLESATRLAGLLRERVADTDFGIGKPVTSSFGVAQYQAPETLNDLVARADWALYRAKGEGRNRVCAERPVDHGAPSPITASKAFSKLG